MQLLARSLPLLALAFLLGKAEARPAEERLVDYLMHQNRIVPPGSNGQPVTVSFGVSLIDVDIEDDFLISRNWLRLTWTDERLAWNSSKYSDISVTRVPVSRLWQPDLKLYNSLNVNEEVAKDIMAVVNSDGSVLYIPPAILRTRCDVTGSRYNCSMKFGSWTYSSERIDLKLYGDQEKFDTSDYTRSDKYAIEAHPLKRFDRKYPCCKETYPSIEGYVVFKKVSATA